MKLRLYLRLPVLAFKLLRATRPKRLATRPDGFARVEAIISEAEAIHRDLGHDYDHTLILPRHRKA